MVRIGEIPVPLPERQDRDTQQNRTVIGRDL